MKDNHLIKTLLLPTIVIIGLLLLYYLPEITIFGEEPLRKIDILSDVKKKTYTQSQADKLIAEAEAERNKLLEKDSVFPGVTPIEDFSTDSISMMEKFYSALSNAKKLGRPVRIAYYGDSFICCDLVGCDLREMLQDKFGGCGVGAVDLVKPSSRLTVTQDSRGLTEHKPTIRRGFVDAMQSMNTIYATCDTMYGSATLTGTKFGSGKHLNNWTNSLLYFRPSGNTTISCSINGGKPKEMFSGTGNKVQVVKTEGDIHSVEWKVKGSKSAFFFASNEGKDGIVLDNFGLVSARGSNLRTIPQETLNEFAAIREYDLIIFQYGLNVASPKANYDYYSKSFDIIISNFHKAWPDAALMISSVSDRCKGMVDGKPATMKGIEELVVTQREIAKRNHIVFWSLFSAMGGRGGMAKMQEAGEASKDYTHLSHKGGKKLATKLYDALMNGMFNYERKQKTINDIDKKVNNIKDITR